MRSQLVVAVSHVADAGVSSGFVGGVGLVAIAALVLGGIGMVVGLTRHHRKSLGRRAEETASTAVAATVAAATAVASTAATAVASTAATVVPSEARASS